MPTSLAERQIRELIKRRGCINQLALLGHFPSPVFALGPGVIGVVEVLFPECVAQVLVDQHQIGSWTLMLLFQEHPSPGLNWAPEQGLVLGREEVEGTRVGQGTVEWTFRGEHGTGGGIATWRWYTTVSAHFPHQKRLWRVRGRESDISVGREISLPPMKFCLAFKDPLGGYVLFPSPSPVAKVLLSRKMSPEMQRRDFSFCTCERAQEANFQKAEILIWHGGHGMCSTCTYVLL